MTFAQSQFGLGLLTIAAGAAGDVQTQNTLETLNTGLPIILVIVCSKDACEKLSLIVYHGDWLFHRTIMFLALKQNVTLQLHLLKGILN